MRLVPLLLLLVACASSELALETAGGRVSTSDPGAGEFPGLVALPNLDDDDLDEEGDFAAARGAEADDDREALTVPGDVLAGLPAGQDLVLVLDAPPETVRVWHEGVAVLGAGAGERWVLPRGEDDLDLEVEVGVPAGRATLVLQRTNRRDRVLESVALAITGAPLVLNHHLQPAEQVFVMEVDDGGWSNASMVDDLRDLFGDALVVLPGRGYRYDVWVQDEPEFGTFTAPGRRLDLVVDSVRNRGLDRFPESLTGPGTGAATFGERTRGRTWDSFGNLEVTPPVEGYPLGRVYYGAEGPAAPDQGLRDMLDAQAVQAPFTLDTSWLCVGHVDEFTSFVPDPTAPRGFRLLVTDVDEAWDLLDGLDPDTPLPRYESGHGYATVGALAGDVGLRRYNDDLQIDHIDPAVEAFRDAIALTDEEIIRVPGLFEHWSGCGAAALIPGVVNLLIADVDGTPRVVMADPFLRADASARDTDPLIADLRARLPAGLDLHFVNNWSVYHLGLGEVHCGTNTRRTPQGAWWTDATDLLEAP